MINAIAAGNSANRTSQVGKDTDLDARSSGLYGFQLRKCFPNRRVELMLDDGRIVTATDFATNSPFALNCHQEVIRGALEAIADFGALHASIAYGRAGTGRSDEICDLLASMKGNNSRARLYPTTYAANCATAAGLAAMNSTVVVHPNAHATVQSAIDAFISPERVIRTLNTCEVGASYAKSSRRPVTIVEDGLYSMGCYADFDKVRSFLDMSESGWVWFDDAHSVGLRGESGRGEAMERMNSHQDQSVVTGSLGKAVGGAGGFLAGPATFVDIVVQASVADRFSCNLDIAGQGAVLAALKILQRPQELHRLQTQLHALLARFDTGLAVAGYTTAQHGEPIAFRVVPFSGPSEAISAAATLLDRFGCVATPVFFPTIARGSGAIRLSFSTGHSAGDIDTIVNALSQILTSSTTKGAAIQ